MRKGNDVPRDGTTQGEIMARSNTAVMAGYYNDPEATAQALRGGWFPHRRRCGRAFGWLCPDSRPPERRHHQRRRKHLSGRSRVFSLTTPGSAGGSRSLGCRMNGRARRRTLSLFSTQGAQADEGELREFARSEPRALQRRRTASPLSKSFPKPRPARFKNTSYAHARQRKSLRSE